MALPCWISVHFLGLMSVSYSFLTLSFPFLSKNSLCESYETLYIS